MVHSSERPIERRKWILETGAQDPESLTRFQAQKTIVQYYIKSPPTFYLSILIASRNVNTSGNNVLFERIDERARAINEVTRPGGIQPFTDALCNAPGIVTSGPPIAVRILPNAPFEYVIGRNQQNLDNVPAGARRWFSRRHCAIQAYFGKKGKAGQAVFALKDLGSSNGSYLNGKVLAGQGTVPLMNNDVIGVSMTDEGGLMLGFRFQVVAMNERRWASDSIREIPLSSALELQASADKPEESKDEAFDAAPLVC